MDDGEQLTPKNHESTPETLRSENVLAGKASKTDIMPDSRFLQKKLEVKNFVLNELAKKYIHSQSKVKLHYFLTQRFMCSSLSLVGRHGTHAIYIIICIFLLIRRLKGI